MNARRALARPRTRTGLVALLAVAAGVLALPGAAFALDTPVITSPADNAVLNASWDTTVSFTTFSNPDLSAQGYMLFRATDSGGPCDRLAAAQVAADTGAASSLVDSTVTDGLWCYWVEATNGSLVSPQIADSVPIKVSLDGTPPVPSIDSGQPAPNTQSNSAGFVFSGTEGTTECKLDTGSFGACTSSTTMTYSGLSQAAHTFTVRSTDAAGNVGSAAYSWTVDSTAPSVQITTSPALATQSSSAAFVFSGTEGTTECKLDTGPFGACDSSTTMGYTSLSEGSHTFTVQSTDLALNVGSDTYTWAVDTTAPAVTIGTAPAAFTQAHSASFAFSGTEGTTECKLDAGSFAACDSSTTMTYASGIAAGAHSFTVQSTDPAGNVGSATATWTVDNTAPAVSIVGNPALFTSSQSADFTFSGAEGTIECRLDGGAFTACDSSSTMGYLSLSDAAHSFTVRSTDAAGNVGSDTYAWTVDTVAPVVAVTAHPLLATPSTSASFSFSGAEGTIVCKLDAGAFGACNTSTSMSYSGLAEGGHTFTVQSTDAALNVGSDTYSWTVDHTSPAVSISSGPANPSASPAASFVFSGAEGVIECKLDSAAYAACTSSTTMSFLSLADGSHTFTVRSTDAATNVGTALATWMVDQTPPTVPSGVTLTGGSPRNTVPELVVNTPSTDSGGHGVTYRLYRDGVFTSRTSLTSTISDAIATDGSADATYHYTVRAVDNLGNESADSTPAITVVLNAGPPSVPAMVRAASTLTRTAPVISWDASTGGPAAYRVLRDNVVIGTVNAPITTFSDPLPLDGSADRDYTYTIVAVDELNNASPASTGVTITLDTTRPAGASSLAAIQSPTAGKPVIVWPAGAIDVAGYNVYRGGAKINGALVTTTSFSDANVGGDGTYVYTVRAVDKAGNESADSISASVLYDSTAPGTPGASAIAAASGGTSTVSWAASTDAGSGVVSYQVRRSATGGAAPINLGEGVPVCGVLPAASLSCGDAGLVPGASYRYAVFAIDAVGNVSMAGQTNVIAIPSTEDRTPPKAPTGLRARVANGQIRLSWKNPKADLATIDVVLNAKRAPRTARDGSTVYHGAGTKVTLKLPRVSAGKLVRFAVFALDPAGNASVAARATVTVPKPSAVSLAPDGKLGGSPNLTWNAVTGATYYNVQVFEGTQASKRVGIVWPTVTKWTLPGKLMKKGKIYTWYVWPGIGAKASAKYGKLIGKVTFKYTG